MSKQRLVVPRLMGYIAPLIVFIFLALWFRPQDRVGWAVVGFGALLACVVSFATFAQARSQINKRSVRHDQFETNGPMEDRPPRESHFVGPYGEQDMGHWLRSQP